MQNNCSAESINIGEIGYRVSESNLLFFICKQKSVVAEFMAVPYLSFTIHPIFLIVIFKTEGLSLSWRSH
jgi:hypothetical protein